MAGNLKMTTSDLTTAKTAISTEKSNILEAIQNVQKAINKLTENGWRGDAANAANDKINEFYSKTYPNYSEAVEGYISFIDDTVRQYDTTEDALAGNAKDKMDSSSVADFV